MYAELTTSMYAPDKIDDAIRDLRARSSQQEHTRGFRGFLFFLDRTMGKGVVLSLWDTEDDLVAADRGGHDLGHVGDQAPYVLGQAVREIYEVVVDEWVGRGEAKAVRVTTRTLRIDKVDEAIDIMRDSIVPAAREQRAWRGMLSLANRRTGRTATLSFWEGEGVLKASETGGYYQAQVAKTTPVSAGQPTREIYEIVLQQLAPTPVTQSQQPQHNATAL